MSNHRSNAALSSTRSRISDGGPGTDAARLVRTVLVDHEPLAREWLRRSLEREDSVEIVAECGDGEEAISAVERCAPDVVFLEVDLPGRDGFEVLDATRSLTGRRPDFVFVTAEER